MGIYVSPQGQRIYTNLKFFCVRKLSFMSYSSFSFNNLFLCLQTHKYFDTLSYKPIKLFFTLLLKLLWFWALGALSFGSLHLFDLPTPLYSLYFYLHTFGFEYSLICFVHNEHFLALRDVLGSPCVFHAPTLNQPFLQQTWVPLSDNFIGDQDLDTKCAHSLGCHFF